MIVKTADPLKPHPPRSYLANPRHFGRFNKVEMNEGAVQAHPEAATAARWQHHIAVRARIALHFRGITHEEFAKQMGREKQYLYDRLNGQRWLTLTDLGFLAHRLEVRVVAPSEGIEGIPVDMRVEPRP